MTARVKKIIALFSAALVLINVVVFFYVHSRPIRWQQREMTFHNFFWSMDGISTGFFNIDPAWKALRAEKQEQNAFHLHSGLRSVDFLKPLIAKQSEGDFRLRQFSYLFEMLSFKYWQWLGVVSLRDYSLIGLHIVNCALLFFIIFRLNANVLSAMVGAFLFLNSGITLATLLFPFRSAKILIVLFFLMAWLILIQNDGRYAKLSLKERLCFWGLCLAGALTDEYAVFLFALIIAYLAIQDGAGQLFKTKFRRDFLVFALVFLIFAFGLLKTAQFFDRNLQLAIVQSHFEKFPGYFSNLAVFSDTAKAFFQYFLPRNFGYWDSSPWGIAAGVSFTAFLGLTFWKIRLSRSNAVLIAAILVIISVKAFILPHNSGVHKIIMPEGTVFPSLFFFSYYYVYFEAMLFSLVLGLLVSGFVSSPLRLALASIPVIIMACSASVHLAGGPREAIEFHHWTKEKEQIAKNVLAVKAVLKNKANCPVYLSYPSGSDSIFKRNVYLFEGKENLYNSLVLSLYLRNLERAEALVSLENISAKTRPQTFSKLREAKTFLDLPTSRIIDLRNLDFAFSDADRTSQRISQPVVLTRKLPFHGSPKKILFFILGNSTFELRLAEETFSGAQNYGYSYQAFEFPLSEKHAQQTFEFQLAVFPKISGRNVALAGPFVICDDERICQGGE